MPTVQSDCLFHHLFHSHFGVRPVKMQVEVLLRTLLGKKTVQEMVMLMLLMHYHKKNLRVIERVEKIIPIGQDLLMLRI